MFNISSTSNSLRQSDDGIWYSESSEKLSYPQHGHDSCYLVEDNSFWFKHRNNCIVSVVKSYPPRIGGAIFDIGGGNGYVSLGLTEAGFETVLVEPGNAGVMNAKTRGLKNIICATTGSAKFKRESLSAVGLFDVVEHIENDVLFLQEIHGLLEKNSFLYLTVPAYSLLWSNDDVTAGHYRRYKLSEINKVLELAGYSIEYSTYIFRFIPIPILLFRTLPYILGVNRAKKNKNRNKCSREHLTNDGILSKVINTILKSELTNIRNKISMRFGGSCLIVAKKL